MPSDAAMKKADAICTHLHGVGHSMNHTMLVIAAALDAEHNAAIEAALAVMEKDYDASMGMEDVRALRRGG